MKWMVAVLAFAPAAAPGACRELDADRIRAGDLAAAHPSFATVDAAVDIGPAPLAGVKRVFHPEELARLARRFGIAAAVAPADVCFERASQVLNPGTLLPVLEAALAMEGVRIEVSDYSRAKVPRGAIEFLRAGLSASGFWRGRVKHAEGRSSAIWARIRVTDAGTGAPVSLAPAPVTKQPTAPMEVERGETVQVRVSSGAVRLGFQASAETAGRVGEMVIVKNPANGRRVQARVEEKGKVSIQR